MTAENLLQGGVLITGASVDDVNNHGAAQFMSLAASNTLKGATASDLADVLDAACGGKSFTGDTNVVTASGKQAPISSLKQGEKVEATDTKSGKNEAQTVLAVLVHHDTNLYDLKLQTATGPSIVHTTSNHLIWDETTHTWTEAAKLHTGDHLRTADGTIALAAGGTTPKDAAGWMWDLTISNDHDFYVNAGNTSLLVHNCGPDFSVGPDGVVTDLSGASTRVGVPTLEGGTVPEVGAKIWGNGDPTRLVGTRTPAELRELASLSDAQALQDFYQSAALAGKGGITAPTRVVLTQEIIDAWVIG